MARLYLSFLGTNNYVPCTYFYGDIHIAGIRFVQEATVSIFCGNWEESDRILIFTTGSAKKYNWGDGGYYDDSGQPIAGLGSRLKTLALKPRISAIDIPEGTGEAEIWQIFQIIYDQIKEADQVVFDITHAFRSIPMLAMVVLPYARVMKNITIEGIYYGAFEVLGHPAKVKELPMDQRQAPIFNLTPFSSLLDWTLAIDRFLGAGDARPVCQLAQTSVRPILKETKGQNPNARAIRQMANLLAAFSENISTCRGREVAATAKSLQEALKTVHYHDLLPPLKPLLNRLSQRMASFTGDTVQDGIRAARWCLEHNLIQQGFTILQETLITLFVSQGGVNPSEKKQRELASQAVTIFLNKIPQPNWRRPAANYPEIINALTQYFLCHQELAQLFRNLTQCRNDLNHAGYVEPRTAEALAKELANFLRQVEKIVM